MNRKKLIKMLEEIQPPSQEAAEEYAAKKDIMVAAINQKMMNRNDILNLIGKDNLEMMKDNHANHARFIESILRSFDPEILTDTVLWVFRAYRCHGFQDNYWAAQLNAWIEVLKENLTPENYDSILPIYNWMLINIPNFVLLADEKINEFEQNLKNN